MHYALFIDEARAVEHFNSLLLMASVYLVGTALYAFRLPERLWPGTFDLFLNSHQLFHVLTVIGTVVHYRAVFELANHRMVGNTRRKLV